MIQKESIVKVADNSGAREAKVVSIPGASKVRYAKIGDIVVVSVQKTIPNTGVKDHELYKAVVVRTKKELRRKDGTYIRFDDNAVVLVDPKNKTPR